MKPSLLRLFLFCFLAVSAFAPAGLRAQAADTSAADAVLDKHLAAIGGAEALKGLNTRITRLKITAPAVGMEIAMVTQQKAPDRYLAEQTIPGMGTMYQGYDGTTAWAFNSFQGYRELEGAERAQLLAGADLRNELNWRDKFPVRERLPDTTVEGVACEVVKLSGGELPAITCYFDASSHLMVRMDMLIDAGPQGQIPMTTRMEDYRVVNGVKIAHRMAVKGGPMEMQMVIESLEQNVPLDDAIFAPKKS